VKRKLTTIFYADGVGFSAGMEADEVGTLERLHRARAIMAEVFEARDGRQVNSWGDAVIAEFPSVVEAVRAAVEVQDALATENLAQPPGKRLAFRIGVNLGDVMIDGDNLYGDGVNLAERLQSLAQPGGVAVSDTVHSLVHKQLALSFDPLGEMRVKSLAEPVNAWAIAPRGRNAPDEPPPRLGDRLSEDAFTRAGTRIDAIRRWVMAQPRGVQRAAFMIGLFFAINLLFTGIATPWFLFPSIPFALYIWRHVRRTRRRQGG
jgi:adenylate cyclase